MIEDEIYRSSSQYRLWSYTRTSLQELREKTNNVASERVHAAARRTRGPHSSATPSVAGTPQPGSDSDSKRPDGKEIECLTPEEELVLVRYYCEQVLELGEAYKPPLPTMVRVSFYLSRTYIETARLKLITTFLDSGHCNSISSSFLPHQLSNDLPSKVHHGLRALPCDQDR